jgi:hypothetical protein
MVVLLVVFVDHFCDLINPVVNRGEQTDSAYIGSVAALAIELGFIAACVAFVLIVYFCYYTPKYKKRLKTNPQFQQRMTQNFEVLDG